MKMALKIFFLHLLFVVSLFNFAQTPKIDSLKKALSSLPKPTNKLSDSTYIKTLNDLAKEYLFINPDTAISLAQQGLQFSEKIHWKQGKAICLNELGSCNYVKGNYPQALAYYNTGLKIAEELSDKSWQTIFLGNIGNVYSVLSDYPKAIEYYFKALKITEELGDKRSTSALLGNIGIVYHYQSDYPKALEFYFKALKMKEELGDKREIAITLGNIGVVYKDQSDYPKALAYYFKALKIDEELGNKNGIASHLGNIGVVYKEQSDYSKALEYYYKALKIAEELGDKRGIATNLGNIGVVYENQYYYHKALECYFKAFQLNEEIGNKRGVAFWLSNIGNLYRIIGKFKESEKYLKQALALSDSLGTLEVTRNTESHLYQLYDTLGQYKLSLIHYKKYIAARDSIDNDERRKQINYLATKYEWEKKEAVMKEQQEKERALFLANQRRNKIILYSVLSGLALVLVFSFFIYRSLRITKKQKHIIEAQKHLVEEKNKEITDSIRYAKRIQNAILPPDKVVKQHLKESFILYLPKDIVAGDFYWLEKKNNTVLFAACDCTGHGVPGAMVSVICNNGLNRSVREHGITEPGKILDKTREIVVAEFEKSEEDVKDGMDISLCALNGNHLQWAGANNPLWIIRNGELIEYAPNKQPIGKVDNPTPFTTHHIELQQGDKIYIFSDGYADQFGGEKGKKFKAANLKKLLLSIQHESMEQQKTILQQAFNQWKANLEQVDDVLVMGVSV
jgi:tetratricopeptide (TPR) repeat protein/serine phosphatase RsbU (regulator of sigma subunit)